MTKPVLHKLHAPIHRHPTLLSCCDADSRCMRVSKRLLDDQRLVMAHPVEEPRSDPMFLDFLSEQLLQGQDPFLPDAETPFDIWHQRTAQLQPVHIAAVADQQVWVHSMPGMRLWVEAAQPLLSPRSRGACLSQHHQAHCCTLVELVLHDCHRVRRRLRLQLVLRPVTAAISSSACSHSSGNRATAVLVAAIMPPTRQSS